MVIFVIALLVLGPKRLPGLARSLGKGLAEFRRASTDMRREFLDVAEEVRIDPNSLTQPDPDPETTPPDPEPTSSSDGTAEPQAGEAGAQRGEAERSHDNPVGEAGAQRAEAERSDPGAQDKNRSRDG